MSGRLIHVSVADQRLTLWERGLPVAAFPVATAARGVGEIMGSERTPRGWHYVRARIGDGAPLGTVFVGRRPTGEIYTPDLGRRHSRRDWILTRILWLCGLEPGRNRGGRVDTQRRYVYIHGCPDEHPMGIPSSHGCVKMRNRDVVTVFDWAPVGTRVLIEE